MRSSPFALGPAEALQEAAFEVVEARIDKAGEKHRGSLRLGGQPPARCGEFFRAEEQRKSAAAGLDYERQRRVEMNVGVAAPSRIVIYWEEPPSGVDDGSLIEHAPLAEP